MRWTESTFYVQCDECGKKEADTKQKSYAAMTDFRAKGWSLGGIDDLCPECKAKKIKAAAAKKAAAELESALKCPWCGSKFSEPIIKNANWSEDKAYMLYGNMTCSNPECSAVGPTIYGKNRGSLADSIEKATAKRRRSK